MDKFILNDEQRISFVANPSQGRKASTISMAQIEPTPNFVINKHFASFKGVIKVPGICDLYYAILEDRDWEEFVDSAGPMCENCRPLVRPRWGMAFAAIVNEVQKFDFGLLYMIVTICPKQGAVCFQKMLPYKERRLFPPHQFVDVNKSELRKLSNALYFDVFEYTQKEALKERYRIEKFRNRATHKAKMSPSKLSEPSPIWIRDGIQYAYTYEDEPKTHREILCELWSVRGHYRHYKSGKVTFIAPYQKGKKRNEGIATGHTYILEKGGVSPK